MAAPAAVTAADRKSVRVVVIPLSFPCRKAEFTHRSEKPRGCKYNPRCQEQDYQGLGFGFLKWLKACASWESVGQGLQDDVATGLTKTVKRSGRLRVAG